jgi:hypothetical protein
LEAHVNLGKEGQHDDDAELDRKAQAGLDDNLKEESELNA